MPASIGSADMAARSSMVKRSRISRAFADGLAIEGQGQADIAGRGRCADRDQCFPYLALRIAPPNAVDRGSPANPSASFRLSLGRSRLCRKPLGGKRPSRRDRPRRRNLSIIEASVSLVGASCSAGQRQHALLQPRHGQRRHRDVLAVIGLRQVLAAHVDVVGDQVLALARWIGTAAEASCRDPT